MSALPLLWYHHQKKINKSNSCCLYTHWNMVPFPVASPLKKTESFPTATVRSHQLWRATHQPPYYNFFLFFFFIFTFKIILFYKPIPVPSLSSPPTPLTFSPPHSHLLLRNSNSSFGESTKSVTSLEEEPRYLSWARHPFLGNGLQGTSWCTRDKYWFHC